MKCEISIAIKNAKQRCRNRTNEDSNSLEPVVEHGQPKKRQQQNQNTEVIPPSKKQRTSESAMQIVSKQHDANAMGTEGLASFSTASGRTQMLSCDQVSRTARLVNDDLAELQSDEEGGGDYKADSSYYSEKDDSEDDEADESSDDEVHRLNSDCHTSEKELKMFEY